MNLISLKQLSRVPWPELCSLFQRPGPIADGSTCLTYKIWSTHKHSCGALLFLFTELSVGVLKNAKSRTVDRRKVIELMIHNCVPLLVKPSFQAQFHDKILPFGSFLLWKLTMLISRGRHYCRKHSSSLPVHDICLCSHFLQIYLAPWLNMRQVDELYNGAAGRLAQVEKRELSSFEVWKIIMVWEILDGMRTIVVVRQMSGGKVVEEFCVRLMRTGSMRVVWSFWRPHLSIIFLFSVAEVERSHTRLLLRFISRKSFWGSILDFCIQLFLRKQNRNRWVD